MKLALALSHTLQHSSKGLKQIRHFVSIKKKHKKTPDLSVRCFLKCDTHRFLPKHYTFIGSFHFVELLDAFTLFNYFVVFFAEMGEHCLNI